MRAALQIPVVDDRVDRAADEPISATLDLRKTLLVRV